MPNHGQCNGCLAPFGVFKKEHSCKNCKFSFCAKCLSKKIAIPHLRNEVLPVCMGCHTQLTRYPQGVPTKPPAPPPDAYYKRLAETNTAKLPQTSPGTKRKSTNTVTEIENRLDKLQIKKGPIPSVSEIENRLNKLHDRGPDDVPSSKSKQAYIPPDGRSQQEKVDDLFLEVQDEVLLDNQADQRTKDLERRLNDLHPSPAASTGKIPSGPTNDLNLAGNNKPKDYTKNIDSLKSATEPLDDLHPATAKMSHDFELQANKDIQDLHNDPDISAVLHQTKTRLKDNKEVSAHSDSDNENADFILQKILAESKLDNNLEENAHSTKQTNLTTEPVIDPDELPWCCMCNEDAVLRCPDCDMDLYCNKCFRKCHRQVDMKSHAPTAYRAPPTK